VKIVIDDLPNAFGELERDNSLHDLLSAEICPRYSDTMRRRKVV
jgi:hypothetical protein